LFYARPKKPNIPAYLSHLNLNYIQKNVVCICELDAVKQNLCISDQEK
jgi:hypothetical protein